LILRKEASEKLGGAASARARDWTLNPSHEEKVKGHERIFKPDGNEPATSTDGNILRVANVVCLSVGNEDPEGFERSSGEQSLDFLSRHDRIIS